MVDVELDIFSGRPNPRWQLSPEEESQLASMIRGLVEMPPVSERPGILGYRGVRVTGLFLGTVFAANGRLRMNAGTFHDADRRVERWVLETGRNRLSPEMWNALAHALQ